MDLQLQNKLALVTGSTAGIGFAIARNLSSEGARTIINGRSQEAVERAISELAASASGEVLGFAGDLSTAPAAGKLFAKFPDVEILINNLGIYEAAQFEEIADEDWRRFFEVNVLSGVRLCRLYLPGMKKRNWGRIIFIFTSPDEIAYLVTSLASPRASATTGAALRADGGVVKSAF